MKNTKRVQVIYKGRVQGVGFRFIVMNIVSNLHVTGYVKNSHTGYVELVGEGLKTELEMLLRNISLEMGAYVTSSDIMWTDPLDEFSIFKIEH